MAVNETVLPSPSKECQRMHQNIASTVTIVCQQYHVFIANKLYWFEQVHQHQLYWTDWMWI